MADQYDDLIKGFSGGVHAFPVSVVEQLTRDDAYEAGRRAARSAVAPALWRDVLGDNLDTARVADLLKISRQAISKRLAAGTLIGLRGSTTTHFPVWQFDLEREVVRPEVRDITAVFLEETGSIDSEVIISWAATEQHEDLGGETPAALIAKSGDVIEVLRSARRLASRLAQ